MPGSNGNGIYFDQIEVSQPVATTGTYVPAATQTTTPQTTNQTTNRTASRTTNQTTTNQTTDNTTSQTTGNQTTSNTTNFWNILKSAGKRVLKLHPKLNPIIDMYDFYKRFFQDGGSINYYQQGGNMNQEQEIQKAFMAFLIEDAAAQGVQIQSEQDLQTYAQQLGEEGLKAKYQEFMQKMQGGVKAKLGAKLNYLRKIKGLCPEGQELVYMKEGGRMCPKCMQKAQTGGKASEKPTNPVQDFKNRKKTTKLPTKYDGVKHERLAILAAEKKATPAQKDSLNAYYKLYQQLPDNVKINKYNDQEVQAKACGGKAKKKK